MVKHQSQLSRKQMRKQEKQIKKQKKVEFFNRSKNNYYPNQEDTIPHTKKINKNTKTSKKQHPTKNKAEINQDYQNIDMEHQNWIEQQQNEQFFNDQQNQNLYQQEGDFQQYGEMQIQSDQDDKMIEYYQNKLKMDKKEKEKKKHKLMLRENGLEDDFFDFLDDISKKVKGKKVKKDVLTDQKPKKSKKKTKQIRQQSLQKQQQDSEPQWEVIGQQNQHEGILTSTDKTKTKKQIHKTSTLKAQEEKEQQQKMKKSLNSLLNKISDGNILKISRQINAIFVNNAKSKVFVCFGQLFIKFNIQNPKILVHILAANVALACGLHHLYDNQFFSNLVWKVVERFDELQKSEQIIIKNQDDVQMNQTLQKKKNCLKVFCYMYMLQSITIDFVKQLFFELTQKINHSNIELLYLLVTSVGAKIREDDPKVLKDIIGFVQSEIALSKNQGYQQNNKVKFILHQLNQLKLNKKCLIDPDQRFNFLVTFIKRNIIQQNGLTSKIFVLSLQETRNKDKTRGFWWQPSLQNRIMQEQQHLNQNNKQITQQTKYLDQLARQQKMVTEKKKKIFISIMKSEDYLQATQNILQLKIKNPNQVADVIVQICSQEKTFNMFYVYLANKLIECSIRYKNAFKFSLWNQQKQLENYNLRKISNLAKLMARLIIVNSECSLAFLKNMGDLMNMDKFQQIFTTLFLQEFFENVQLDRLGQLLTKIRVGDNNKDFKRNLQQYLSEDYYEYCRKNVKSYKDKVKMSVRLLNIEQNDQDREGEQGQRQNQ